MRLLKNARLDVISSIGESNLNDNNCAQRFMKEPVGRRPDPTHLGCGIHPRASSTSKLLTVQRRPRSVAVVGIQSRFENTGKDESKCPRNIPHKHIWAINPIRPHVPLPVKPESCRILVLTSTENLWPTLLKFTSRAQFVLSFCILVNG